MSKSLMSPGLLAGVAGSVLIVLCMAFAFLFPDTNVPSAPFYGFGALLLLISAVSLLLVNKGRPEWLSGIALVAVILGLATMVAYTVLEILSTMGVGSTDGYWDMLMWALLVMVVGMSTYGVTAVIARIVPAWVGLSLAFSGAALLVLTLVVLTGFVHLPDSGRDPLDIVAALLLLALIALWGVLSLTVTRSRGVWDESSSSTGIPPRSDVTA
jgi:hypothetical protein